MTRFIEWQHFRQPLLWFGTLTVTASATAYTIGVLFEKYVLEAFQHKPAADTIQMMVALVATSVAWVLLGVLFSACLVTRVRDDAVVIRFFPFARELRVPVHRIRGARLHAYRPIADFGGWGIRDQEGLKSYTVSGDRGVMLTLDDGGEILLGSQRPNGLLTGLGSVGIPTGD